MESLMSRRRVKIEDDELDVFHGTSVKKNHIVIPQGLLLNCWYPTQSFEAPNLNEPQCQFNYGNGRKSPFLNEADARRLTESLRGLLSRIPRDGEGCTMGDKLKCGDVQVTGNRLHFANGGSVYRAFNTDPLVFVQGLIDSLTNFVDGTGVEYPFFTQRKYERGVDTNTMMLVTHHGDLSYEALPSYLRYIHSTNGRGGELTLQYGQLRMHLNEGHTRGVSWKHFLVTLCEGVTQVLAAIKNGSQGHTERLYADHVVLGKYNIYASMIREYRGVVVVISSDLSCVNSKVSFVAEGNNLEQLEHFLNAVVIYLEKNND